MGSKRTVVFGLLGSTLDAGKGPRRWDRWRPTVAVCGQQDMPVARLELLYQQHHAELAQLVTQDIAKVAPSTDVRASVLQVDDPWDFEQVYGALHDFARAYSFRQEAEDYLVHITTGTHVAQICLFLLTEARYFPARLIQTAPGREKKTEGTATIIDLDLSKYDRLAARFRQEQRRGLSFLKSGIDTRNQAFNDLMEEIERVAIGSQAPILLLGPTGAGKTELARRIFELKKARRQVAGSFVEVNCATLRGDQAMSTLFGHVRGAFTGAVSDRPGLLRKAHAGVLFLDEVAELGLDEQAMLLRAIEHKEFYPVGADREVKSDFQLIAGTNRDLGERSARGQFRDDLLARIDLWTFRLPGLRDRREDIEPNLDFELDRAARVLGVNVTFNKAARQRFLAFATGSHAQWLGNFRDFNAAITRMATLAPGGRITTEVVDAEVERLERRWSGRGDSKQATGLVALLGADQSASLDAFDRVQLDAVVKTCRSCKSLSEAGRVLFAESRKKKRMSNDADRLRKYLARFGLSWADLQQSGGRPSE